MARSHMNTPQESIQSLKQIWETLDHIGRDHPVYLQVMDVLEMVKDKDLWDLAKANIRQLSSWASDMIMIRKVYGLWTYPAI